MWGPAATWQLVEDPFEVGLHGTHPPRGVQYLDHLQDVKPSVVEPYQPGCGLDAVQDQEFSSEQLLQGVIARCTWCDPLARTARSRMMSRAQRSASVCYLEHGVCCFRGLRVQDLRLEHLGHRIPRTSERGEMQMRV